MIALSQASKERIASTVSKAANYQLTQTLSELSDAAEAAVTEAITATVNFEPFFSAHEGFAVLKEEVDELWDAIKQNDFDKARKEVLQVAAMALRYYVEFPGGKAYEHMVPLGK